MGSPGRSRSTDGTGSVRDQSGVLERDRLVPGIAEIDNLRMKSGGEPKFRELEPAGRVAAPTGTVETCCVMAGEDGAAPTPQRVAFVRTPRLVTFFGGRPPSRPFAREACALRRCASHPRALLHPDSRLAAVRNPRDADTRARVRVRVFVEYIFMSLTIR